MSGKIEISRQLAERLLNFTCNEEYDELRALLAGPVVDRQEPVAADIALDKAYRNGMMAGFSFGIRGDEDGYAKAVEQYDAEIHAAKTEPSAPVGWCCPSVSCMSIAAASYLNVSTAGTPASTRSRS